MRQSLYNHLQDYRPPDAEDIAENMKDPDIRKALLSSMNSTHANAFVICEMQISGFRCYVDVAAIGDGLHGYEIKSDTDSLSRLRNQVPKYDAVCDTCTIVTTRRHFAGAKFTLPDHWGLIVAHEAASGVSLEPFRGASVNPNRSTVALLELLTRTELVSVLRAAGYGRPASPLHKLAAVDAAYAFFGDQGAKELALSILRLRRTWTCRQLGVQSDEERIAHALHQGSPFICLTTNHMW